MLLVVEVGAVKEGSGFLPSRRVLGRAITGCTIKVFIKACAIKVRPIKAGADAGSLKQVWRRGGVEEWRNGALEACCRCSDMEAWSSRDALQE